MTEFLQFALLGLGAGAAYALLGQGLVLIFRGSGVLNLAHGAFAMAGAYLFYELHTVHGHGTAISIVITMLTMAAAGAIIDQTLMRRLRGASGLARVIGTLGLLIVVQAIAIKRYGTTSTLTPELISQEPVDILGTTVSEDRLWLAFIATLLTVALWLVWRYSRLGWMMSAVSENERAAAAVGVSPQRVSALTWALGAALAALAGILIAPIVQLSVTNMTLMVIPAMGAALIGGFVSFPLTLAGGLALGMGESLALKYVQDETILGFQAVGATKSVPFLVIVIALALRGSSLPLRGYVTDKLPAVGTGRFDPVKSLVVLAVGVAFVGFIWGEDYLTAAIVFFAIATILLSQLVITGYSGQLSLAQFALAGLGALFTARLIYSQDFPFWLALIFGTVGAALVGLVFALPALRTRGVELAVVTLGLGTVCDAMIFNNSNVTTSASGTEVGNVHLFGTNLASFEHPARYALFAMAVFAFATLLTLNVRRGRSGRRLLAVRNNERAAAAMGISVFNAKLHAFAFAGAIAGLGGVVLGFRATNVIYTEFNVIASITAVAQGVIGGIGYLAGPLIGALLAPSSLGQELSGADPASAAEDLPLISGLLLLALLVVIPDGAVHTLRTVAGKVSTRLGREPAPFVLGEVGEHGRVTPGHLQVEDLGVRYGGVVAADGVHFTVGPGEVLGLIGPNGAGKTSIVDAVSGFTKSSGKVTLDDQEISRWRPHRRAQAGLVRSFQGLELYEDMTVLENLLTAGDQRDFKATVTDMFWPGKAELHPVAISAIRLFELEDVLDKKPDEISYGQRRLVAIARAVAMEPSVLLLDEPVAGLDENESQEFALLVRRLADEWGIGVLVIEHDMDFVMTICDRIYVIDFGKPIAEGTPSEVRKNPAAVAAYLGEESDDEEPDAKTPEQPEQAPA